MLDHLFTAEQRRTRDRARIHRDIRLASIWTGTNEVMSMIVAHEWYREARAARQARRYLADAAKAEAADELVYE